MKTVIELAREAGATAYTNRHYPERPTHTFNVDRLERFAELVRADERARMAEQPAQEEPEAFESWWNSLASNWEAPEAKVAAWKAWEFAKRAPPQPPAQPKPLTKVEVDSWVLPDHPTVFEFAQFVETKLKENT